LCIKLVLIKELYYDARPNKSQNYLMERLAVSHGCLRQMYQLREKNLADIVVIYGRGRKLFRPPT